MKREIVFVTKNQGKLDVAKNVALPLQIEVINRQIECPEIQDDSVLNIAKESAKFASNKLKQDVVVSDVGLFIEGLEGFPGPYCAFVEKRLDSDMILKMMKYLENRDAYYQEAIAFCRPGEEPVVFSGMTKGKIATEKSGKFGFNFDRIFIRDGDGLPIANYEDIAERFSTEHWKELISYLEINLWK